MIGLCNSFYRMTSFITTGYVFLSIKAIVPLIIYYDIRHLLRRPASWTNQTFVLPVPGVWHNYSLYIFTHRSIGMLQSAISPSLQQKTALKLSSTEAAANIIEIARLLIAAPSPNPPLDNSLVATVAVEILRKLIPSAEVSVLKFAEVSNVIARVRGAKPGRRLVLCGHLDTYPVGDSSKWTVDPFEGKFEKGRLYGRGACDMKGGIAASIAAMQILADLSDHWDGELVLTLGGDEESMGDLGVRELINKVSHAKGDAALIADAGSPMVTRFGEKGFLWITVDATGSPGHGAHVHRGINAIDRLRNAMDIVSDIRKTRVDTPPIVYDAISSARATSEKLSGAGETEVLTYVTVNIGKIEGGSSPNLIPASASFAADIRIPVGVSAAEIARKLEKDTSKLDGVTLRIDRLTEPSYTDPKSEIVQIVQAVAADVLGEKPALNMRVGASDARIYRQVGVPTVVYGPTPYNMGGADEYVLIDELTSIMKVQVLTALEFLGRDN
jgi:acetylornithine deacetylase/succinyl-diaminopimelate desuccinylase-like protein